MTDQQKQLTRDEDRVVSELLNALVASPDRWQRVVAWERWTPELVSAAGSGLRYSQLLTLVAESLATHLHRPTDA